MLPSSLSTPACSSYGSTVIPILPRLPSCAAALCRIVGASSPSCAGSGSPAPGRTNSGKAMYSGAAVDEVEVAACCDSREVLAIALRKRLVEARIWCWSKKGRVYVVQQHGRIDLSSPDRRSSRKPQAQSKTIFLPAGFAVLMLSFAFFLASQLGCNAASAGGAFFVLTSN